MDLDEDLKNNYMKNYLPRLKFLNTKIYNLEKESLEKQIIEYIDLYYI